MKKYFQFIEPLQKRLKNIFRNTNRPTDDFLEWCGKKHPLQTEHHILSKYYPGNKNDDAGQDNFLKHITEIADGEIVSAQIDRELAKDLNVIWPGIRYDKGILQLHIAGTLQKKKIILKGGSLRLITIDPACNAEIEVINCAIAYLEILGHSNEPNKLSLTVKSTYIGELHINGQVKKLDVYGGCLLKINCSVPTGKNPFCGSVWFKNVFFPTNAKKYLREDAQPYRNMSYHLRELENTQMAHLFHRLQLRTEREKDSFVNRIISILYGWSSDFGASAFRPIVWMIFFVAISLALILINDGAVLAYPIDGTHYVGWKETLTQQNELGFWYRSIYLSTQPIVNPLGIFSHQPVVVAKYPFIAFILLIQGFFSAVFIALIIFAIRRRFKLQ